MTLKLIRWCLARLIAVGEPSLALAHPVPAAQMVGPVTDDIGVIKTPAGALIQIGGDRMMAGADTPLGLDSKRGLDIATSDIGGKLLGNPIKFDAGDDLPSA